MSALGLLLSFTLLFILGWVLCCTFVGTDNPFLKLGLPLPVGLAIALGLSKTLHNVVSFAVAWNITLLILVGVTVTLAARLYKQDKFLGDCRSLELSKAHYAGLGVGFGLTYFFLHTQQVMYPENDFLTHFPLIGLFSRGVFPPPNPYYPEVILHGHFGRDYLIALLSRATSGDHILTIWMFNHLLHLSAFLLAAGLGLQSGRKAAVVMVPTLLFFGVNVGSRVGLVDTFDNNNLLVYTLLLALLSVLCLPAKDCTTRGCRFALLAVLLGIYAIVYETHMILVLGVWLTGPFIAAYCDQEPLDQLKASVAAILASLMLGILMGGAIQDLAMRAVGFVKTAEIDRFASYESQRVQISFPKKDFLQVFLGMEEYNRVSYVYQTKLLKDIPPELDEGGYTFIFSPRFLVLHWLALYLGLPAGLYLIRRRDRVGLYLWTFGLYAFLTPAVVDFGPVHELEYFRWEFAAGFGFAGALGVTFAHLWDEHADKKWLKLLLVILILGTSYGGIRRLNRTIITFQKAPQEIKGELYNPIYGSGFSWMVRRPDFEMESADIKAAQWLREADGDRLLLPLIARTNPELTPEASILGLAGMRAVGHQSPPPWLPVGTYPYFHNPNWTVFWQQLDGRALAGLKADWVYLPQEDRTEPLRELSELELAYEEDGRLIYGVKNAAPDDNLPQGLEVRSLTLPDERSLQSEVAAPLSLQVVNSGSAPINWQGLLGLQLAPLEEGARPTHLLLQCPIELAPGAEMELPFWLVPPLVEGEYELEFFAANSEKREVIPSPPTRINYNFKKQAKVVQLGGVRNLARDGEMVDLKVELMVAEPGFKVEGPVSIGTRVYDAHEKRYGTPYGFDSLHQIDVALDEPGIRALQINARLPDEGDRYELHFFLVSLSRLEVRLK